MLLGPGIEIGYLFDLGGTVSPFIQINAQFLYYPNKDVWAGFKLMPIAGVKFFMNKIIALDLGAFFNYSKLFDMNGSSSPIDGMFVGMRFGASLYL